MDLPECLFSFLKWSLGSCRQVGTLMFTFILTGTNCIEVLSMDLTFVQSSKEDFFWSIRINRTNLFWGGAGNILYDSMTTYN